MTLSWTMANASYFRLDDGNIGTNIYTIIDGENSKPKTHSTIYCMKDNWKNGLNLRHTLDWIYLTSISYVHSSLTSMNNDDNKWKNMWTYEYDQKAIMYPLICTPHRPQSSQGNENQLSWDLYEETDRMWGYTMWWNWIYFRCIVNYF